MTENKNYLRPEDYEEPRCLICGDPAVRKSPVSPIPQGRIIEKMNEYMSKADYAGAERHLLYWLEEAEAGNDEGGELLIRNELIGHYRKTGDKERAFINANKAIKLVDELNMSGTISAGTTFVNSGTAFNAFGENERALECFEKAESCYNANRNTDPELIGGLLNNKGLALLSLKRFDESLDAFNKAFEIMGKVPGGKLEQAITQLNKADVYSAMFDVEKAEQKVFELMDSAECLILDEEIKRDGYFAFVCEKCAPSFEHYGFFLTAIELKRLAKEIYEGT